MPYSEIPPAHVVPESRQGHYYYNKYIKHDGLEGEMYTAFCNEFEDSGSGIRDTVDEWRPLNHEVNACSRRRSDGNRAHSWCYRCVAGYPYVAMHIYDAERESDRRIDLGI